MIKRMLFLLLGIQSLITNAQSIVYPENDSTFHTEFKNGCEWGVISKSGFVIGVSNQMTKDSYGSYYQLKIMILNQTDSAYTFDPAYILAKLYKNNGDAIPLKVYTNEAFQKKMKNSQMWAMALTGFANGINTGMAGYQTAYTTQRVGNYVYTQPVTTYNYSNANASQIASNTQLMLMGKQMENDRYVRQEGYLKKHTINSGEGIIGYMNIKKRKGQSMTVIIPIKETFCKFTWNVSER